MKLPVLFISFLMTAFSVKSVHTDELSGLARVQDLLSQTRTLQAEITQELITDDGLVDETKTGTLSIKRPGKFRWDYEEPFEELLVTNGKTLWMWDVEMESLVERTLDETLSNTPASLLAGGVDLKTLYELHSEYEANGLNVVELTPKTNDTDFKLVRLGFDGQQVSIIELKNSFDQITRITLKNIVQNPELDDSLFDFKAPPGVEPIKNL